MNNYYNDPNLRVFVDNEARLQAEQIVRDAQYRAQCEASVGAHHHGGSIGLVLLALGKFILIGVVIVIMLVCGAVQSCTDWITGRHLKPGEHFEQAFVAPATDQVVAPQPSATPLVPLVWDNTTKSWLPDQAHKPAPRATLVNAHPHKNS